MPAKAPTGAVAGECPFNLSARVFMETRTLSAIAGMARSYRGDAVRGLRPRSASAPRKSIADESAPT